MAASTIEPAIGASTCAFGSHRCTENIGSFTKNPSNDKDQNRGLFDINGGNLSSWGIDIKDLLEYMKIAQKIISIGREAEIVYIIKYMLAWTRSGWYPHVMIIIIVGIREASNQI